MTFIFRNDYQLVVVGSQSSSLSPSLDSQPPGPSGLSAYLQNNAPPPTGSGGAHSSVSNGSLYVPATSALSAESWRSARPVFMVSPSQDILNSQTSQYDDAFTSGRGC